MKFSWIVGEVATFFERNKLLFLIVVAFIVFVSFYLNGANLIDPDFGWRLRTGQIILHKGFPKTDPFTYSMPSFPFVDHAWFFSLAIAVTYPIFQNRLLSLLLSFAVFVSIFISNKRLADEDFEHGSVLPKYERWFHPMNFVTLAFLFNFFAVRAQTVSWLIFSILCYLLFWKDNYARYRFFLPPFFLIWANLHGGYSLGLIILTYFLAFRFLVNKKRNWKDALVAVFSLLVTLITPYKIGGWSEVTSSLFDSRLRWAISEWLPAIIHFDVSMIFFIAISVLNVYLQRKSIPKIQLYLFWIMLFMGLTSKRNMPYFFLYSLPLVIYSLNKFYISTTEINAGAKRFSIAFSVIRIFSIILVLFQMYFKLWMGFTKLGSNRSQDFYPTKAVALLEKKEIRGNIFSSYGWGGFLIWKIPEYKVFIDGRMPSWHFIPPNPEKETESAFDDYLKIENGELEFAGVANKYNIEYVLWPVKREGFKEKLGDAFSRLIKVNEEEKISFVQRLKNDGWSLIYSDETAEIFQRSLGQKI